MKSNALSNIACEWVNMVACVTNQMSRHSYFILDMSGKFYRLVQNYNRYICRPLTSITGKCFTNHTTLNESFMARNVHKIGLYPVHHWPGKNLVTLASISQLKDEGTLTWRDSQQTSVGNRACHVTLVAVYETTILVPYISGRHRAAGDVRWIKILWVRSRK